MAQAAVHIPARSGMRATGRISASTVQPLRPRNSRKGLLTLTTILMVCVGILIQQNFSQVSGFINRPITKVRIENVWQQISEAEVRILLIDFMGSGYFNFDVAGVKQKLEQHPWVERASIKKLWPDSLSLDLTEQVAIAHWGNTQLLNQKGEIFQPPGMERLSTLPILSGPEATQLQVMEQYQAINQLLFPSGLRLTGLELSPRGSWELNLNDSLRIVAGRSDVFEKLNRFIGFYDAQPSTQTAAYKVVDLRYENGIAIEKLTKELAGVAAR